MADIVSAGDVLVLSGAGISTDSGIPDYRGPETIKRKRKPIQHRDFVNLPEARRSYWARSSIGWPMVRDAVPNSGHRALADLESCGFVCGVITQNVDGLHQAAGSSDVLELHGSLYDVCCLACGAREARESVQRRLFDLNPRWSAMSSEIAPDGDVELPAELEKSFRIPACKECGGIIKPEVVFFGDSVPGEKVELAWRMYEESASLLVAGSSLTVFSGYRFVRAAARDEKPIIIVNAGDTRGDAHATIKSDARIGEVLPVLGSLLCADRSRLI